MKLVPGSVVDVTEGHPWFDVIYQTEVWVDRHGRVTAIDQMTESWRRNVLAFIVRNAPGLMAHVPYPWGLQGDMAMMIAENEYERALDDLSRPTELPIYEAIEASLHNKVAP